MIDTHTHLYDSAYAPDGGGEAAVRRALAAGVSHMIFPNVDLGSIDPMLSLAAKFPGAVSCAMGLHPTELGEYWQAKLKDVLDHLKVPGKYVAVGEIGIDLHWDASNLAAQMQAFDAQLAAARAHRLPVIIHCREGLDATLEVLQGYGDVPAVFHSFGGTADDVERIRRQGDYFFGINGIVTFKNSGLRDTLPAIGLDRMLLETDAPYLAPVPHRGKRNESALLPLICDHIAASLGTTPAAVDNATTAAASRLFGLPQ